MSKTAAVKEKKVFAEPITTLAEADEALHRLADMMRNLKGIEADAEKAIDLIVEEKLKLANPIREQIGAIEEELASFMAKNKASLFTEKRSQELNYGTIGFRKSTKIRACKDTLKWCKEFGYIEAIKVEEKLRKEVMEDWADEKLRQVGAKREVRDLPYYETTEFNIRDLT
ncbi:MAG: host-nuclease inhibitor Gam family protein [bacterium]